MTAAFLALSLGLAIQATGQPPSYETQPAGAAPRYSSPTAEPPTGAYWIPQQNGTTSVPYYYPYQKRRAMRRRDYFLPPGPGEGWGFPNGFPDGYGWADYGPYVPMGADRISDYYFPRYHVAPPEQMFFPTYYNPYQTRGQQYLPFIGGGGAHPAGGPPISSSALPVRPYASMPGHTPAVAVPRLNGRTEAPFVPSGTSGLTP